MLESRFLSGPESLGSDPQGLDISLPVSQARSEPWGGKSSWRTVLCYADGSGSISVGDFSLPTAQKRRGFSYDLYHEILRSWRLNL